MADKAPAGRQVRGPSHRRAGLDRRSGAVSGSKLEAPQEHMTDQELFEKEWMKNICDISEINYEMNNEINYEMNNKKCNSLQLLISERSS